MVSPELIRRFPYFSGLTMEHIVTLAKLADEMEVQRDHYFHHEGEELKNIFLILDGEVAVVTNLPQKDKEIVISTLGTGDVFGWSAFVPPFAATAGSKAITACRIIAFDAVELRRKFEEDPHFGYVMMQKVAQIIRDRLNALRIETLAYSASD